MNRLVPLFFSLCFLLSCGSETENVTIDNEPMVQSDSLVPVDSVAFFNEQVALHPNDADWLYKRAVFNLGKGELFNSKADLENAINMDPMNLDARLLYGNLQLSMTHLDTSKIHYEFILEQDSANTGALIGMSKLYALLNNSAMADLYISSALKVDEHLAEAYFMRGIVYRSDFYETGRQESWDRAISSFQTTVEQDPDYYSAYIEMGVMHDQIKSDLALEYYNSALDIYPESQEAWYNVGMFHQTRGNTDEAIGAYQTIISFDSTWADPYYNQGYIHLVITGELDSSIYYFNKATDLDPDYYQAYNNLGLAYETQGDIENAKKSYGKAIEAAHNLGVNFQLAKDNLNSLQ